MASRHCTNATETLDGVRCKKMIASLCPFSFESSPNRTCCKEYTPESDSEAINSLIQEVDNLRESLVDLATSFDKFVIMVSPHRHKYTEGTIRKKEHETSAANNVRCSEVLVRRQVYSRTKPRG